ncbi:MAG: putative methyltransferase [Candidatus Lokiarchaeota archaeon]|nr:putative methyltransferase [Candidatus Lokiarchaeota archaeon]
MMSEFFEKLMEHIDIEEGLAGIRDILLTIYRTGTVSIKNISRTTKIPIPIVSKVVNILVKQDFLTRNEKGVQFWDRSMQFIEKFFGFYGYGIEKCPVCKGRPIAISPRMDILFKYLNPIFERRPQVNTVYDQSKGTVETSIQRTLYFYETGAIEGKEVLFIGDDDFTSVALSLLYLIFFPEEPKLIPKSITVIDIDERILKEIKTVFSNHNLEVRCINYNLKDPVPKELLHKFDTIITDPPYSLPGLTLFLSRAISMLNRNKKLDLGQNIFLSYAHRSSETTLKIQKALIEMGLAVMEITPSFNKYEGSEILGNITQLFHLKTTSKTSPSISASQQFVEKFYTGETHPYIRKYQCKLCQHVITVGPDKEFETIELLKGNKCPKCGKSKTFTLIEKNLESID